MASTLIGLSNESAEIVQALDPYIVSVRARRHYPSSGLRWGANLVVTSDHAIQREEDIAVTLPDGKTIGGTLVGRDPGSDLAILRVEAHDRPVERAGADLVKAGELAFVVGRSPDSGLNASLGIISAVSGTWRTWRGGQLDAYIRLDARLFPHSSGGAVVNARGEIIGMATSALSRIAGIAVPFSTIKHVSDTLVEKGFMPRGYLGVGVQRVPFSKEFREKLSVPNASGLIVITVEPGGPAERAGILIGDILITANDVAIEQSEDLRAYSDSAVIGAVVKIKFIRGGVLTESTLTIGERPRRRS